MTDQIERVIKVDLLTPGEIRYGIEKWAEKNPFIVSERAKGAIRGAMANALKSCLGVQGADLDYYRHLVTGYLVTPNAEPLRPMSTNDLTNGQWVGFSRWQSERLPNGQYRQRPTFADEVVMVLYRAKHDLKVAGGQLPIMGLLLAWEEKDEKYENWYDLNAIKKMVENAEVKNGYGV